MSRFALPSSAAERHGGRPGSAVRRVSTLVLAVGLVALPIGLGSAPAAEPFAAMGLSVPRVSRVAPRFTLPAADAQTVRLGDYVGQVVLLNFWATWCPPCRLEMPALQRLYTRFKERGFVVLAVSVDTAGDETVTSFATAHGLTFPLALDATMRVATRYGVRGLPSTFLLDRRGRIRAMVVGPREWDTPAAYAAIATLLDVADDAPSGAATHRGLGP